MSCKSHTSGGNRAFDYIYDPSFITSGSKDIWRLNSYTVIKYAPVKVRTRYNVMFANIPKNYRQIIHEKTEILPHFRFIKDDKSNSFDNNKNEHIKNESQHKFGKIFENKTSIQDVKGANRAKFFFHNKNSSALNLKLYVENQEQQSVYQSPKQPKAKNVGVQTIYRESSAQTKPYLPDAIIVDSTEKDPEIIRIANLLQGIEQPGEFEIGAIERMRKKREWERTLPKLSSKKEIEKRKILFEAIEWEEWLSREEQIKKIQDMRLDIVEQLIKKREEKFKNVSKAKLENSMKRIEEERLEKIKKLDNECDRNLRKLELKYKNSKEKSVNIVDITKQKSSKMKLKHFTTQKKHFLSTYKELNKNLKDYDEKIEDKFPEFSFKNEKIDKLAKPKEPVKEIYQGFTSEQNLKQLYETLQFLQTKGTHQKIPKCLTQKTNETKENEEIVVGGNEEEEESTKIIKDHAVQNMSHMECKESQDNIEQSCNCEFSATENSFSKEESEMVDNYSDITENIPQHEPQLKEKSKIKHKNSLDKLFEFLNNELKRLQEERKAQALCMLAEHERTKRENSEMKLREKENQIHRENDEIYYNIAKTSQDTVTLFLENVLIEETNLKACKDAQKRIQQLAKNIDIQANEEMLKVQNESLLSFNENVDADDETISDITDNFLFPEIQKHLARKNMENIERCYLQAAHNEIYEKIENIFNENNSEIILKKFIEDVCSTKDILSQISSITNVTSHEITNIAIKKAIEYALSQPNWKESSTENVIHEIFNKTIDFSTSEIDAISYTQDNNEILEKIINDVNRKLWHYAFDNIQDDSQTEILSNKGASISTLPAFTNLLEYKEEILPKNTETQINAEDSKEKTNLQDTKSDT